MLVDGFGGAAAFDGSSWTIPRRVTPNTSATLTDVSCVRGAFCIAGTSDGYVQFRRHGNWSDREPVDTGASIIQIECGSARLCVAATLDSTRVFGEGIRMDHAPSW